MTVRLAPYIEQRHESLLSTVASARQEILNDSPYDGYTDQDVATAFIGTGYALADFPSLYDMYGKFLAGYDLESLWQRVFDSQMEVAEIDEAVAAEINLVDDAVDISIPQFTLAMREINATTSSTFVIGKANIERSRIKGFAVISSEAKFGLLSETFNEYIGILNWQKGVVDSYAEYMKLYYIFMLNSEDTNKFFAVRDSLWSLEVLNFEGVVLGYMRQLAGYQKAGFEERKRSDLSKVFLVASYTAQGAAWGSMFPGLGTAIGTGVGFVIGVAIVMSE